MMRMAGFAVALMMIAVIISPFVYGKEFSDLSEIKVQRLLKQLNKPALNSIKSEDGDIIDCVPIASQPALDHPLLRNHTIQMRPRFVPEGESKYTETKAKSVIQVWQKNGECPRSTVPIRRTKKEDILRANSVEGFRKKTHQSIPDQDPSVNHEYAVMDSGDGNYFGTQCTINIWKPSVEVSTEFSLAQIWLVSGDRPNLNTIEAGWQVYPDKYLDHNPRLFVFWTRDGYHNTKCYNLNCSPYGFVQMSNTITPGGSLLAVSQLDGEQKELSMLIWKDGENWWLKIGDELVGYWPGNLFTTLNNGAKKVQWGGEIVNLKTNGRHTTTDMGSGNFAEEGEKKASYFRNIMVVDKANAMKEPQTLYKITTHETCYNFKLGDKGTSWGINFFFGGPGQNPNCP